MKKLPIIIVMIAIGAFALSCSKNKDGTTAVANVSVLFPGQWKLSQTGSDANHNGVLDSSEVSTYTGKKTETYNSTGLMFDSAFYATGGAGVFQQYQWSITGNNYLQVKSLDSGAYFGNVYSYHVDKISASQMQLQDSSASPRAWYIYTK